MRLNHEEVQQIIDALRNYGFNVRSYSGRAMYGANCVGLDVESFGAVMNIAVGLIEGGIDPTEVCELGENMRTDNMGLGYIVYWPALELSEKQHDALMQTELTEDEEEQ